MELADIFPEKMEQQYLRLAETQRWTGARVPNVSPGSFTLAQIIGQGRNTVYSIIPSEELRRIVSPGERGLVAKRQDIGDASDEALEMIARAVTLDADTRHRMNEGLLRPKAYAIDDSTIYIIDDRYDLDAQRFIDELRTRIGREAVISTIGTIGAATARYLAQFHDDGGIHRDIKPQNIGIMRDDTAVESVKLTDFDLVSRKEQVAGPGITTILSERGTVIGTPHFLPDDYLLGRRALGEFSPMELDGHALGVTIKILLSGEWLMPAEAYMDTLVNERRRYLSREEHWLPLERALHRIAVKATAKEGTYTTMREMAHDIDKAMRGQFKTVDKSTDRAWIYRNGQAEAHKTMTRRWFVKTAVGAAIAAPLWDIIEPYERWEDYQYRKEYAQSLEGLARKAADLDAEALKTFMLKESSHFKNELEEIHMPRLAVGAMKTVAVGSFEGYQTPSWATNTSAWIGHMLARLRLHWDRTHDPYFIDCYAKYINGMALDLDPRNETGDMHMSVVARFEDAARAYPALKDSALPTEVKQTLERGFWRALCAATVAFNQYDAKLCNFGKTTVNEEALIYTNQERIMPLLAAIGSPEFDASMREKVLQGSYAPDELKLAGIDSLPSFSPLTLPEMYLRFVRSGKTVADALFANGRSYSQAFIGTQIRRKAGSQEPGFDLPEHLQVAVAQDLTRLMLGQSSRLSVLRGAFQPSIHARLKELLGPRYGEFHDELRTGMESMERNIRAMDRVYKSSLGSHGLPPEYLFIPEVMQKQLQRFHPLEHDALAAVQYGTAMGLLSEPVEDTLQSLLRSTPMNHAPRMQQKYSVGTLISARAGVYDWHGTCIESDRYFDELLTLVKR